MRVAFVGPPGCGKGTQAKLLRDRLGFPSFSTGDALREEIAQGTDVGSRIKPYMNSGQLVPDSIVNDLVVKRLGRDDCAVDFVLDGYPRNVTQARTLAQVLKDLDRPLEAVILFHVDDAVLEKRLLARRRADDTEETVRTRLRLYHETARELIGHYKKNRGLVHTVSAGSPVEHVYVRIACLLLPEDS
jgi:adenylate kinase